MGRSGVQRSITRRPSSARAVTSVLSASQSTFESSKSAVPSVNDHARSRSVRSRANHRTSFGGTNTQRSVSETSDGYAAMGTLSSDCQIDSGHRDRSPNARSKTAPIRADLRARSNADQARSHKPHSHPSSRPRAPTC